ncbi:MAG: protein-disulfide reductase DsbD family protein [Crocinitomicaceae bacterium]
MLNKIILFSFILLTQLGFSQDEMPDDLHDVINWSQKVEYNKDEATIVFTVDQKDGWHVYSQVQPEGAVAYPTEFFFKESPDYQLVGKVKEYGAESHGGKYPEKSFPGNKAVFKQKIKILSEKDFTLRVDYVFMACKEACFPPTDEAFDIKIKGYKQKEEVAAPDPIDEINNTTASDDLITAPIDTTFMLGGACEGLLYTNATSFQPVKINIFKPTRTDLKSYSVTIDFEVDSVFGMYSFTNPTGYKSALTLENGGEFTLDGEPEIEATKVVENNNGDITGYKYKVKYIQKIIFKDTTGIAPIDFKLDVYLFGCENDFVNNSEVTGTIDIFGAVDNGERSSDSSLWLLFLFAFLGGFLALLTPCVFPMIPMTVSFFTKQSKTKAEGIRKAILYAVSIIVIYVILGVLVSSIFGETALNEMATHPWVNIGFFVLFVVFAISFFGAFEIQLPASWVNKADKNADKGGLIGIFFMAFTLALVSFSCTGPIVGSVLVQSAQGGFTGPIVAMLGFSTALALPFGLFAAFPGWLNSLPSSGGWLNTVKVVLGFLELALALKFLSNADLVKQWHLLEREVFLAIWIGIFIMLFIYLIGKIQLPHDSKMEKLSVGRMLFALINFCFIIYLIPGLFGAPLKLISGFPPPMTYSESPFGFHGQAPEVADGWPESTHAHGHGINTIRDYYEALEYAKQVDKPLLIDFTGWACVNCRKMEEQVWADESVSPLMANDFVIASLYVDDREELTGELLGKPMVNGKKMKTVGDRWMNLQIEKYQEVTQPLYVVVDHNANNISGKATFSSHGTPEEFKKWLEFAKDQFKSAEDAVALKPVFKIIK